MKHFTFLILLIIVLLACSEKEKPGSVKEVNPFYIKAFKNWNDGKIDSTFYNFNKAKESFLIEKDSLNAAISLSCMGIITTDIGDHLGGLELSLNALSYFNESKIKQHNYIHRNYNNLGIASYRLKDYTAALKFYDLAIKFANDSIVDRLLYLNNKAKVYEELKEYDDAILMYTQVLKGSKKDKIEYARVLTSLAFTKWLQNSSYNPLPELLGSLSIREKEKDLWGQNHSHARLADYYTNTRPKIALIYATKMHQIAQELNSPDDKLEALEKLIKLSPIKKSKLYFERYRNLEDSIQVARNKSKNQFALIRYETEKHKADNLILQKDNTEKKYQLIKQRGLLIGG